MNLIFPTDWNLAPSKFVNTHMNQDKLQRALQDFHRLQSIRQLPSDDTVRVTEQPKLVSRYYDAVTSFYEFGWGTTFHFSPRRCGESLPKSQRRHEEGIGKLLRLSPEMVVADVGCGVGGPLMTIARSTGANILGINFNSYQIQRGERKVKRAGLSDTCSFLYADYMKVPLEDCTFDAMYSFDAICHAPDRRLVYRELYRLLKPGCEAAIVDWVLTDSFDPSNARHNAILTQIEINNLTWNLTTSTRYLKDVQDAGFDVIEAKDQQVDEGDPATPWYKALEGRDLSLSSFSRTPLGRAVTTNSTRLLEGLRILPKGTSETARILSAAADSLVEAGKLGIFVPSFLIHARKPK